MSDHVTITAREVAEQTLDATLPYEETWHENATNVLALLAERQQLREALSAVLRDHDSDVILKTDTLIRARAALADRSPP